jgi:CheY-like chemotaxis protein
MSVVIACQDLMFRTRIGEAARGAGVEVRPAPPGRLAETCRAAGARLVIADLDDRGRDALAELGELKADPALAAVRVVGFLSHVDAERAGAARAAGVDRVMARSAFVRELPALLAGAQA